MEPSSDVAVTDDLNPNEAGSSFFQPEADPIAVEEINEEKAMVTGAGRVLLDFVITWCDTEIEAADSIAGLDLESHVELAAQVKAQQLVKIKFQEARSRLQSMRETYLKE